MKGISSTSYKYKSKDITEFEDKTVKVEISKGEHKSKIVFDLFENILLSTVLIFINISMKMNMTKNFI